MNYNDFPILSNEEFGLINEHFKQSSFDRKSVLYQINQNINSCKSSSIQNISKLNKRIVDALNTSKSLIVKTSNNILEVFNSHLKADPNIKAISIFDYMQHILIIIENLNQWAQVEKKEYYKNFLQKTISDFVKALKILINALNESNVHFFKYM